MPQGLPKYIESRWEWFQMDCQGFFVCGTLSGLGLWALGLDYLLAGIFGVLLWFLIIFVWGWNPLVIGVNRDSYDFVPIRRPFKYWNWNKHPHK